MTLRPTVPCFGVVPLLWKALAASACQTLRTLLALWRTNSAPRTAFFMWNAKNVKLNCNIWLFVFMWLSCGSFLHPMCVSRGSRSAAALRQPIHPCEYAHAPYGRIRHRTRFVWYSRHYLHIYTLTPATATSKSGRDNRNTHAHQDIRPLHQVTLADYTSMSKNFWLGLMEIVSVSDLHTTRNTISSSKADQSK